MTKEDIERNAEMIAQEIAEMADEGSPQAVFWLSKNLFKEAMTNLKKHYEGNKI